MLEIAIKNGTLKIQPMHIPAPFELPLRPSASLRAEIIPPISDNPLLDEMAEQFNWTPEEKFQQGEQMKDEIELEGWPSEIPPDCPQCKQRLRLDETCAGCGWGTIPFLPTGDVNWAEADCGT